VKRQIRRLRTYMLVEITNCSTKEIFRSNSLSAQENCEAEDAGFDRTNELSVAEVLGEDKLRLHLSMLARPK
jgi:hypothetical protein